MKNFLAPFLLLALFFVSVSSFAVDPCPGARDVDECSRLSRFGCVWNNLSNRCELTGGISDSFVAAPPDSCTVHDRYEVCVRTPGCEWVGDLGCATSRTTY